MKTCTVCKEELPYESYHKSKVTKDGYGYRCRECDKKARHKYREANRDRFRQIARKKQLKFAYGITLDDYDKILESQGGGCGICGSKKNLSAYGKHISPNFSVDRCHKTDKVRGLLCNNCNRGLGLLGDNIEGVQKTLDYLNKAETH